MKHNKSLHKDTLMWHYFKFWDNCIPFYFSL